MVCWMAHMRVAREWLEPLACLVFAMLLVREIYARTWFPQSGMAREGCSLGVAEGDGGVLVVSAEAARPAVTHRRAGSVDEQTDGAGAEARGPRGGP